MAEYLTNTIKSTGYSDGKSLFDDPCCQTQPVSAFLRVNRWGSILQGVVIVFVRHPVIFLIFWTVMMNDIFDGHVSRYKTNGKVI